MKSETLQFFVITVGIGFFVWFLAPYITGRNAPSDSGWYLSIFLLVVIGMGFLVPMRWWLWPLGLYFGELLHLLYMNVVHPSSEAREWVLVGIISLAFTIVPFYIFCGVGRVVRALVKSQGE